MPKYLIGFLFLIGLSASYSSVYSQVVSGRITNAQGEVLEYVNVGLLNWEKPIGTTSDLKGRYELSLPTEDSVELKFSLSGYAPVVKKTSAKSGEIVILNCIMTPTQLDEVTIVSEKVGEISFTKIDVQKLENAVGPTEGVESIIKTLPDVASNNELSSQYSVRGGSFDENLVYINGIEVYRPMLVRCGEQEGLSIINPDMVNNVLFSPGGFDVSYGDKMSSVLDIKYSNPNEWKNKISGSFLGGSIWSQGLVGDRFSCSIGIRKHSNQYLLGSLDTKGDYQTDYADLQMVLNYKISEKMNISFLGIGTRNNYALKPSDRSTDFGSFMQQLHLDIYFDGEEVDRYTTGLSAVTWDYQPNDDWNLRGIISAQSSNEQENYDIQSQYWLREAQIGSENDTMFDRGVGTFLEHARNKITTNIFSAELKATKYAKLGNWYLGMKWQYETISDKIKEWKWVDSSGYALPGGPGTFGDSLSLPSNPILQLFYNTYNSISTSRWSAYVKRDVTFYTRKDHEITMLFGVRAQDYSTSFRSLSYHSQNKVLISPRVSLNLKPQWDKDILFRLSAGIYHQPPFYREYRHHDGSINTMLESQHSYQIMGTTDWNFKMWNAPFRLTLDLYYKYITNLIPYTIENLRIRYDAENNAIGYARGLSVRLNGELIEGLESWASLSIMKTQEDIQGDGEGWIYRPTDQRVSFKMFLQDNIPDMPFWRMSLSFIAAGGTPITYPFQRDRSQCWRLPPYLRVDWGNTILLSQIPALKQKPLFQKVDDIALSLEIFNLFNYHNVVSYLWVADIDNQYHAVPNYLTARQLNLKLTITF